MSRRAITLVELLVVIGIVGVLMGLMLPAVAKLRTAAHQSSCLNNLHNQGVAVFAYESTQGRLPPGAIYGPFDPLAVPANASHGIYSCLLGFLDSSARATDYRWDVEHFAEENQLLVRDRIGVLVCPGSRTDQVAVFDTDNDGHPTSWGAACNYGPINPSVILADIGWSDPERNFTGPLPTNGTSRSADIKDGAAFTIMLAEQGDRGAAWCSPATLAGAREVFQGGPAGGAAHPAGFGVVMCDGAARVLSWNINPRVYAALCTRAGEETIGASDF